MTVNVVEPVRKQVVIEAPQARVFSAFVNRINDWWPREHHIGKSPLARAVLEPGVGGRWYAISEDGSECDTGKVLVWDPPRRVVLAWQITAQWQYDPDFITEVEVNFTAEGDKRTRVDLEHRNLARFGVLAEKLRAEISSPNGWGKMLENFARVAGEP